MPARTSLLPFPFPLRVGIDICHIPRIYAILKSPRGARFVRRVLAEEELVRPRAHVARILHGRAPAVRNGPLLKETTADSASAAEETLASAAEEDGEVRQSSVWAAAVFMAGRFAVKEAAIKAHPHRRLTFHDIVVVHEAVGGVGGGGDGDGPSRGPPSARIKGDVGRAVPDQVALVSISHDGDYATATCVGFVADSVERAS